LPILVRLAVLNNKRSIDILGVRMSIDTRKVLKQIELRYGLKLPRKVTAIDYDEEVRDLYVRFKNADATEGEPTSDGKIIVHYNKNGKIVAVEITDVATI
jgi:uncharacterized protein YuzE